MQEKEMAGDYEILQKFRLGGKELLLGYNEQDGVAPYMTCYRQVNFLGDYVYPDATGGSDYMEILTIFLERLQEQRKLVEQFRGQRNAPVEQLDHVHCRERGEKESLEGKLIILRPSSLSPEYRTADCQLGFATGGFGCIPGAGGRAVYFEELYSGDQCRWEIGDVLGIADLEMLPDWAQEKLAQRQKETLEKNKKKERGDAR